MHDPSPTPGATAATLAVTGRLLGLDLGARRVGVAVCDSDRTIATGVDTLVRPADPEVLAASVAALVEDYGAVGVVVGLPLDLAGRVGPAAAAALEAVDRLRGALPVPVATTDERLTTVVAARALRAAGRSARRQREVIDREAAAAILQGWIDHRRQAS